jgi:hypothetical protein
LQQDVDVFAKLLAGKCGIRHPGLTVVSPAATVSAGRRVMAWVKYMAGFR